jgi:hypothetical protein
MDWIHLAMDRSQCWVLMNTVFCVRFHRGGKLFDWLISFFTKLVPLLSRSCYLGFGNTELLILNRPSRLSFHFETKY